MSWKKTCTRIFKKKSSMEHKIKTKRNQKKENNKKKFLH